MASSLSVREDFTNPYFNADVITGFDFAATGRITLKAYYIPSPVPILGIRNTNCRKETVHLWESDWTRLMSLMPQLHPSLVTPLRNLINFIDALDEPFKPRIEIISVDCVASSANRLKVMLNLFSLEKTN